MEPLVFLEKVLPEESPWYAGAFRRPKKGDTPPADKKDWVRWRDKEWPFASQFGQSPAEMGVNVLANAGEWDAYFSIFGFGERSRKAESAYRCRIIVVDVDLHGGKNDYPTLKDAATAIATFLKETKLPCPSMTSTGRGLCLYWVFDRAMTPEEWKPLALRVKRLCLDKGLKIDTAVTGDAARLVRIPGSINQLSGETCRLVMGDLSPTSLDDFKALLPEDLLDFSFAKRKPTPVPGSVYADMVANTALDLPPAQAGLIYEQCAQVKYCVDNQDGLHEPMWHALLGVAAFCEDADNVAREWSNKDPRYDEDETLDRVARLRSVTTGATLCENFQGHRPEGCASCPHAENNHVRSPIILGIRTPEITAPTDRPSELADIPVLDPPYPFKRTEGGIKTEVDKIEITVCPFDIYPVSYGHDEAAGYEVYRYHWKRLHVGWRELNLRAAHINSTKLGDFTTDISDQGIVLDSKDNISTFQLMLREYMKALRQQQTVTNLYSTMGWKEEDTEFVLGDQIYRCPNGTVEVEEIKHIGSNTHRETHKWKQAGNLADWATATSVLDRANLLGHMFAVTVSMSAPLYKYTGLNGLVVSLAGKSGSGKSLAQLWAQSVWGDPVPLTMTSEFTDNALFERMGSYSHLPITLDDVTNLSPKDANNIIYNVTQGRDKHRLNRNAEARKPKTWAAPCIISTNIPWTNKLATLTGDVSAQRARLFEVDMPVTPIFGGSTKFGKQLFKLLTKNHGVMGREIITMLMTMGKEQVNAEVEAHWGKFERKYKTQFTGQERFWEASVILADYISTKAYERGLLPFDPSRCIEWAVAQASAMREDAIENQEDSFSVLSTYLNEVSAMAVTALYNSPSAKPVIDLTRLPKGEIHARYNLMRTLANTEGKFTSGTVQIHLKHLRGWLIDRNYDWSGFKAGLGVALVKPVGGRREKAYLAKDTGIKLPQYDIITVNLNHPSLQGILSDSDNNTAAPLATVTNLEIKR